MLGQKARPWVCAVAWGPAAVTHGALTSVEQDRSTALPHVTEGAEGAVRRGNTGCCPPASSGGPAPGPVPREGACMPCGRSPSHSTLAGVETWSLGFRLPGDMHTQFFKPFFQKSLTSSCSSARYETLNLLWWKPLLSPDALALAAVANVHLRPGNEAVPTPSAQRRHPGCASHPAVSPVLAVCPPCSCD